MPSPIDFYFDFTSPYSYLASQKVDKIAGRHGRAINWRPIMIGSIFKEIGTLPGPLQPLKFAYFKRDFVRSADFYGVPFRFPSTFPISALVPSRAFYWLAETDIFMARNFAKRLFSAYFTEDCDISAPDTMLNIAAEFGIDTTLLAAAIQEPWVKQKLKKETEMAQQTGVFGVPFFMVDNEPFWGADRLDQLEKQLKQIK